MSKHTSSSTAAPLRVREPLIFLVIFIGFFAAVGSQMGLLNMLSTMMNTAYALLLDTVFYILAVAVLAGAVGSLLSEFGVVALINRILSPLIGPIYGLPGAASVGIMTTYLSDNPAILSLAGDSRFRRYFKQYQVPALANIGTSFGMGAIISVFMLGILPPAGGSFALAVLVGNLGAVVGSIVSTRLMLMRTKKVYGTTQPSAPLAPPSDAPEWAADTDAAPIDGERRRGGIGLRFIDALLDGGKSGVQVGFDIIPGVLIICTIVMMLTNGAPDGGYTGAAYEGIALLPWLGQQLSFVLTPLFGFTDPAGISVPITALGAAGAAIGLVPGMVEQGRAAASDIAVFTAMCMCWSGYLSTHVAMMSSLRCSTLTGRAIFSHTIGGLCAGIAANWIYRLLALFL